MKYHWRLQVKIDSKIKDFLTNKNSIRIILIVAFVGIALIALSEFMPESEPVIEVEKQEDYSEYLEQKLTDIIKAITGENSPEVMLTLSGSSEYIYATETKQSTNEQADGANQKESEEKYIIIENEDGSETALLVTELEPEIAGVVIVTQYSENVKIKENIINAVMTVLDLPSNKVCVVNKIN